MSTDRDETDPIFDQARPGVELRGASSIPRPLSIVLGDVVTLAELVLKRPRLNFIPRDRLDTLAAEVAHWIARPCDGVRIIDDRATWLMQALRRELDPAGMPAASRAAWRELAMVLTEQAMACLIEALEADRRPTP
jgi:hypothetical protein